jgi:hypothetical protein
MRFFVGEFRRSEDADYDILENDFMREQIGSALIDDMLKYSARAWKTYGDTKAHQLAVELMLPAYYLHVQVYCEFDSHKHATWFQLKYPQVKSVDTDLSSN